MEEVHNIPIAIPTPCWISLRCYWYGIYLCVCSTPVVPFEKKTEDVISNYTL
jgi:hypothetical protein